MPLDLDEYCAMLKQRIDLERDMARLQRQDAVERERRAARLEAEIQFYQGNPDAPRPWPRSF